ncbi:transcription repressor NadR [Streptococcus infantis]|uniref:transcription repressor NadR n=1 Tax=Streptococcus infantis TaxID=68892 RepID=UPI0039C21360
MTKDRKEALIQLLKESQKPMNGQSLAEHFHVTRQIIVQDIAVLRADGAPILSTNRGYIYKENKANPFVHKLFKVKHKEEDMEQELLAIVDNGGRVQNILIDHPVYGEIETLLKLSCRRDVEHFLNQAESSDFRPLSELTDGIHYHLVEAESKQDLLYIEKALDQLGYLVKD